VKQAEAEKLLGGYAAGILGEAERKALFAAALDHQDLFDALMDEEALRELLAEPAAKAKLLEALSSPAPPKVVPFWRRTGVLGAAASLIVAATAGFAYLRSPEAVPRPMKPEETKGETVKSRSVAVEPPAPAVPARKAAVLAPLKETTAPSQVAEVATPAPPPQRMAAPAAATEDSARMRVQGELRRAEAQDNLAKKAEAPRPVAAALVEVVSPPRNDVPERRAAAQSHSTGGAPGGVPGGVIGGVVGGVIGGVVGGVAGSPASPPAPKAKAIVSVGMHAAAPRTPTWTLEAQPDGRTRVTVNAPKEPQVVLLKRGTAGIEVLKVRATEDGVSSRIQWHVEVRLLDGDVLDLYVLNAPTADPALLPETGSVDGFRARIHPAGK
jgi:hypothetical protein